LKSSHRNSKPNRTITNGQILKANLSWT